MVTDGGAAVRVMAGEARGAVGPIALRNPGLLLDVKLAPHAAFRQEVCALDGGLCRPPLPGANHAVIGSRRLQCGDRVQLCRTLRMAESESTLSARENAAENLYLSGDYPMGSTVSMYVLVLAVPDRGLAPG